MTESTFRVIEPARPSRDASAPAGSASPPESDARRHLVIEVSVTGVEAIRIFVSEDEFVAGMQDTPEGSLPLPFVIGTRADAYRLQDTLNKASKGKRLLFVVVSI